MYPRKEWPDPAVIQKLFYNVNGLLSPNLQADIRIFLPEFAKQKRQQKTSDLAAEPQRI